MKQSEILEKFGSVEFEGYRNGDREQARKKKLFPMFENDHLGEETELFVRTNMAFIEYADEVGWDGRDKILNYRDLLGGKLRRKYRSVGWNGVHDHYDPDHADAETDDGFVRLLEAFFMEVTGHDNPAYAVQEKIKGMKYANQREHDTLMDPKHYKERIEDLMEVAEVLPHPSGWQPASDLDWLNAMFYGLPQDAQDYLKYVKEVDPFDAEHNGANRLDWDECLMEIRPWWVDNYQKIAEENIKKKSSNKRDRDDEDDDNRSNKRRKTGNGGRKNSGAGKNNDKNGDDDKKNNFQKNCQLHSNARKPHKYGECIFCPSSKNFKQEAAIAVYNAGKTKAGVTVPKWWKETMERRVLNKSNQKEQSEQPQQQQYLVQTGTPIQPQQGTAFAIVGQQQAQQMPPMPATQSVPPAQIAPTFATGVPSAQSRYKQVTDAKGNVYFLQL